jgi:hypothetical protein
MAATEAPKAKVGDVIEHGQPIPANVVMFRDEDCDYARRDDHGTWARRYGHDGRWLDEQLSVDLIRDWASYSLTVVKVDPEPRRCTDSAEHPPHTWAYAPGTTSRAVYACDGFLWLKGTATGDNQLDVPQPAADGPLLGLATTRQLLEELKARRITAPSRGEAYQLEDTATCLLRALTPAALDYRTAEPRESGPTILALPQVPDGAVALVGAATGTRYVPHAIAGNWVGGHEGTFYAGAFHGILGREGSVTVESAPPREPRTWPKLDVEAEDPDVVDVYSSWPSGAHRWLRHSGSAFYYCGCGECADRTLAGLRELGEVREVLE